MKGFVDQMAYGIFGERDYELAYTQDGLFLIFSTKEEANTYLEEIKHPANSWRVAPMRIYNGGFIKSEEA